jgi:chitinase
MLTVVGVAVGVASGVPVSAGAVALPQDCAATVAVEDVHRYEGTGASATAFEFTVAAAPCAPTGSVHYLTEYGTATASDAGAVSGTLTWTASSAAQTVTVPVSPDSTPEPEEQFTVRLASPVGLTVADVTATGFVVDDDTSPPEFGTDGKICWRPGAPTRDVAISVRQPLAAR